MKQTELKVGNLNEPSKQKNETPLFYLKGYSKCYI